MIGETVGSYRILSKLSVGGMGTVYRAEHTLIGKMAAVKVLHPELTGSRDIVQRFFNEAKATTAIKHPGIVDIYDFGHMTSGHAYLTMEFLEGMSLARRLKTRGRMVEGEAAMMLRQVCSALAAAHAKGIVHRDLKPDNIFLVTDADSATGERPKILDFGIAKLTDVGLAGTATKTGAVMGTPTYMSPEQCRGTGDVDHRADLYSLGCIFYELVTGRPPFTKLGAGELIGAHIYAEPERPSKHAAIAKETDKLIMSLLDKRPDRRPQSAKELAQRLSALAQQLGWITVTSPDGITARGMRDLANAAPTVVSYGDTPGLDDASRIATTEPPEVTTPYGIDPSSPLLTPGALEPPDEEVVLEKPTTLSGAASQSVIDIKGSRKGITIAMLSVALLAGGTVAAVKIYGNSEAERVQPASTGNAAMPTPDRGGTSTQNTEQQAEQQKAEQQKADQQKAEAQKAEPQKADQQKADQQKLAQEKLEAEKAEQLEAEQAKTDKQNERLKAERRKLEQKKLEQKKLQQKKLEEQKKLEQKKTPKPCDQPPCLQTEV